MSLPREFVVGEKVMHNLAGMVMKIVFVGAYSITLEDSQGKKFSWTHEAMIHWDVLDQQVRPY